MKNDMNIERILNNKKRLENMRALKDAKRTNWIVTGLSFLSTIMILQFRPDRIPLKYDEAGNVIRWGSKYLELFLPAVSLILTVFGEMVSRYFESLIKKETDENAKKKLHINTIMIDFVGIIFVGLLLMIQWCVLIWGPFSHIGH